MSVREYIGARYITKFADPIEHDSTKTYEPLIIVQYQGASYVSRMYVPAGIPITDTRYWLLVADYNAQIAQYRNEVEQVAQDIDALEGIIPANAFSSSETVKDYIDNVDDVVSTLQDTIGGDYSPENTIADALTDISGDVSDISTAVGNMQDDIDNIEGIIPSSAFTSSSTVKDAIDNLGDAIGDISDVLPLTAFSSTNTVESALNDNSNKIEEVSDYLSDYIKVYEGSLTMAINDTQTIHITPTELASVFSDVTTMADFFTYWKIINVEMISGNNNVHTGQGYVVKEVTTGNFFAMPNYTANNNELMVHLHHGGLGSETVNYTITAIKIPYSNPM